MKSKVRNEIDRQMSLTLTLPLDVPVRRMDAKGLNKTTYDDRETPFKNLPKVLEETNPIKCQDTQKYFQLEKKKIK